MTRNNQDKLRFGRVSQHVFVRRERARGRVTRPRVEATSFNGSQGRGSQPSGSPTCSRMFQASTFHARVDEAHEDALEAYYVNQEEFVTDANVPVKLSRGPLDTSLLHLYVDHAARHVWEGEEYLFTFTLHLF